MLYPNPFNPGTAPEGTLKVAGMPAGSSLVVYTTAGELMKQQAAGNGFNGLTEWDGRNDGGREAASGVYVYVVRLGSKALTHGILVLRR